MGSSVQQPTFDIGAPDSDEVSEWLTYRDAWDAFCVQWQLYLEQAALSPHTEIPGLEVYRLAWRNLWETTGQTWRFEPEVSVARQEDLWRCVRVQPDISHGSYPFSGQSLSRADLEYLIDARDSTVASLQEIDLRGAKLSGGDLHFLPLQRLRAGLTLQEWQSATPEQRERACIDLTGAILRGTILEDAILRGAHLDKANLFRANLRNAQLHAAQLRGVDLRNSILEHANLRGVDLTHALLNSAQLEGADIHRGILVGADLSNVRATKARLTSVRLNHAIGVKAVLDLADLRNAHLIGSNFRAAFFSGADLSHTICDDSDMRLITAPKSKFFEASLRDVDLSTSEIDGADFSLAILSDSDLREAHMSRGIFDSAMLVGCQLQGAECRGAVLRKAQLDRANLRDAKLQGADISEAQLHDATLTGAEMARAICIDTKFSHATMIHTNLQGANLQRASLEHADLTGAVLSNATLSRAVLGGFTRLDEVSLDDAFLADVAWEGADLAVVRWDKLKSIGEERTAGLIRLSSSVGEQRTIRVQTLEAAVRAYRQLAVALQDQGINEPAHRYSYKALRLQRELYKTKPSLGLFVISWLLDMLAGYGYVWWHTAILYLSTLLAFTVYYFTQSSSLQFAALTSHTGKLLPLTWHEALEAAIVLSITSFHGRGFFSGILAPNSPIAVASAFEAVVGFIIEISFIATFTRRFFGR